MSEQRIEILLSGSETLPSKRGKLEIKIEANHMEIYFQALESEDPEGEAFENITIERLASNVISLSFENGIEALEAERAEREGEA